MPLRSTLTPNHNSKTRLRTCSRWNGDINQDHLCVLPSSRQQRRSMHRRILHSCPRNHGSIILPPYTQAHQRTTVDNSRAEIPTNNFLINLYNQNPSHLEKNSYSLPTLTTAKETPPSTQHSFQTTTTKMPTPRPQIPQTWHIATLAPGFDTNRLRFPISIVSLTLFLNSKKKKEK
jgi:hypothetical protein